ncbi:gamma-glutamyltransferase, partial [Nocardia gipuzkoensis]
MRPMRQTWTAAATAALLATVVLTGCSSSDSPTADRTCADAPNGTMLAAAPTGPAPTSVNLATNPEIATGFRSNMTPVRTKTFAVSSANPLATQAACRVLADGGTAADALVAAQMVLGLVEPQSSGIGGGAFLMYYDAASKSVDA